ncbi:MAG: deoxyuridine 5'-triphosphate nucleotidohydrolase [Erysipelotrichaceae bacterium]|nr:deoxyuridine 5'-triphosphate nucleotidohydrolase [Erysipelotrichaceae bacterium]
MNRIARFEKVSYERFRTDLPERIDLDEKQIEEAYRQLKLPQRATAGSAGYDFTVPFEIELAPGEGCRIPSAVRCRIKDGWVLQIYPRSSLGFKYRLQLDNTVGIIDADYYHADNEGHIIVAVRNNGDKTVTLKQGDRFVQGLFLPFGITEDDCAENVRTGGFGSTDRQ